MKQLISCASYFGSGSSAVTDLIGEYVEVKSLTEYEFRFIQDIDGIMDLEYHLVMNHHRHNAGHALKRFWRLSQFNHGTWFNARYEPFFGGQYLSLTRQYVEALTDFRFPGYWFMDMYDRGKWMYYWYSLKSKIINRLNLKGSCMPHEETIGSHPTEERFLKETKLYIANLLQAANPEDMPRLMVDQLLPSAGINQCLRYFECDVKLLIVDRDPRDVYLCDKYIWRSGITPRDPELFCKWFRDCHESNRGEICDTGKVMKLQFEDMIFNYEREKLKIEQFVGFEKSQHKRPFKGFNPQKSVHNTQLWEVYSEDRAIKIIKENLSEYLYDFDSVKDNVIPGIEVHNIKRF